MKYNRVLITGGAGFIGSNLALRLIKRGCQVTVLDNLLPQIHGEEPQNSQLYRSIKDLVKFIHGDVRNKEDWEKALKGQEVVVHLAAGTGTGQSMYMIQEYIDVNVNGTALLLDLLINSKHQIKKMVLASSRAIYGEGKYLCEKCGTVYPTARGDADLLKGDFNIKCPNCGSDVEPVATDEKSLIHPTSIYGISKQTQEEMVMLMGQCSNIPAVALRFQNVYGPGQSLSNPYTGILSVFSTRIKNDNYINIFEDGLEGRDFVYIDDVVDSIILSIEKEEADGEVFNVGSGISTDVLSVANVLKEAYHSQVELKVTGNYRVGDIKNNFADITKISKKLGYSPKYSFEEGIARFVEWVNTQQIEADLYKKSILEMAEKGLYH